MLQFIKNRIYLTQTKHYQINYMLKRSLVFELLRLIGVVFGTVSDVHTTCLNMHSIYSPLLLLKHKISRKSFFK